MQLLRPRVGLRQPALERFSTGIRELVEQLAPVASGADRPHEPVALQALERRVDLPDIDFPGPAQHGLKTVFHLIAVQRLLRQEPQHAELKRHFSRYTYAVCIASMHRPAAMSTAIDENSAHLPARSVATCGRDHRCTRLRVSSRPISRARGGRFGPALPPWRAGWRAFRPGQGCIHRARGSINGPYGGGRTTTAIPRCRR